MQDSQKATPSKGSLFGDLRNKDQDMFNEDKIEEENAQKFGNGIFGRIAKHPKFEQITILIILLNGVIIGVDADYSARFPKPDNLYEGPVMFIVFEVGFCTYFTFEILVRFFGMRLKRYCWKDGWFVFDSSLVALMNLETWVLPFLDSSGPFGQLSVLRLVRLVRITRLVKLMKAFPELMIIIKGISAAMKAVAWSGVLLTILTYTWAILFTYEYHQGDISDEEVLEAGDTIRDLFGSMGKSMLSLLVMGTILDDVTACTDAIRATGNGWMLFFFMLYVLLNSFTMLNMLTGILVEVVGNTSESEKAELKENAVKDSIKKLFISMDEDGSGVISRDEFVLMRQNDSAMSALEELDVKEKHFEKYAELLFTPDDNGVIPTMNFDELLECICRLRPGTSVEALEFASFKERVLNMNSVFEEKLEVFQDQIDALINLDADRAIGEPSQPIRSQKPATPTTPTRPGLPPAADAVSPEILTKLKVAASPDIVEELQRRLGVTGPNEARSQSNGRSVDEDYRHRHAASEPVSHTAWN